MTHKVKHHDSLGNFYGDMKNYRMIRKIKLHTQPSE